MELVCPHCLSVNRLPDGRLAEGPHCGRCSAALLVPPFPLTAASFERLIGRDSLPVVVDFTASWCMPCRSFAPVLAEVAGRYRFQARFATLDVDRVPHVAERYAVRSVPTLLLFHRGLKIAQTAGALSSQDLAHWLKQSLAGL